MIDIVERLRGRVDRRGGTTTSGTLKEDLLDAADEIERLRADAERLDWLQQQDVQVDEPLRWGSRPLFQTKPDDEANEPDLRAAIDAARAALATQGRSGVGGEK